MVGEKLGSSKHESVAWIEHKQFLLSIIFIYKSTSVVEILFYSLQEIKKTIFSGV